MFGKEDIEFIVTAMYKDEMRNISEKIKLNESNLAEVIKLNSTFKRYLSKISLICQKIASIFIRHNFIKREELSKVIDSLYERERSYTFELKELTLKKSEIDNSYQYIIDNISKGDLQYVENLILMRSININHSYQSNQSRALQFLME